MRLAIIPARGGSKRIPRKNIKPFGGKPMIAWSIEAAQKSACFDRIIVSTDDPEIADISVAYGAEAPFLRPPELSDDHAATAPVIAHAINWHNKDPESKIAKAACCIYATAPFIDPHDLQTGLQLLESGDADYAFAVTSYAFPVQRAIKVNSNNRVEMLYPDRFNTRSQDLDIVWHDAGQFYWGRAAAWLAQKPVFNQYSVAVKLPRYRVQDIDTEEDWVRAELMHDALRNKAPAI